MILVFRADLYDTLHHHPLGKIKLRRRFSDSNQMEAYRKDMERQKSEQYKTRCAIAFYIKDMENSEIISLMALLESRSYTMAKVEEGHHLVVMIGDQIYRDTQDHIGKLAAPLGRWLISLSETTQTK